MNSEQLVCEWFYWGVFKQRFGWRVSPMTSPGCKCLSAVLMVWFWWAGLFPKAQTEWEKPHQPSSPTGPGWRALNVSCKPKLGSGRVDGNGLISTFLVKLLSSLDPLWADITQFIQWLHYSSKDCSDLIKRSFPESDYEILKCLLDQCFSHLNVHTDHLGTLLKYRLWFSGSGPGAWDSARLMLIC